MNAFAETSQTFPSLTVSGGVTIVGCGFTGDLIGMLLKSSVELFLLPTEYGMLIECTSDATTRVTVEAPLGTRHTDIIINRKLTVNHFVQIPLPCTPAGTNMCATTINGYNGSSCSSDYPISIKIPFTVGSEPGYLLINKPCVSVQVNLPSC